MLTRQYGGDDILALCNAMLSQILGVIITPLILLFFLQSNYINVASFSSVINKLFVQVMIPFIMGQILSQFYNSDKIIQIAKKITFYGIFPLIYISVAQVVAKGNFKNILLNGYYPIIICILFAIFQILVTQLLGKGFNFSRKEKITLLFTAAQKTMGLGIPLVLMYFPNNSEYSTNIIFMFLIYYILSLLIVSSYAKFLNK
jgi:sodium/bile acid cotransporter 7